MNESELNKRFDDINELLKALRENVELLNRIGASFNALIELLLSKKIIEEEELISRIEAKIKSYKKGKSKHSRELKNPDTPDRYSPN